MADMKVKYPATETVMVPISATGLTSNAQGVFLGGRMSQAVSNVSDQDLDHLLSGAVSFSSTPVVGRSVNIYAYACLSVNFMGSPYYPTPITGTEGAVTFPSANVMNSALRFVASVTLDAAAREYGILPVSVASLFGGALPKYWGVFVSHDAGATLTAASLYYDRIQGQTV